MLIGCRSSHRAARSIQYAACASRVCASRACASRTANPSIVSSFSKDFRVRENRWWGRRKKQRKDPRTLLPRKFEAGEEGRRRDFCATCLQHSNAYPRAAGRSRPQGLQRCFPSRSLQAPYAAAALPARSGQEFILFQIQRRQRRPTAQSRWHAVSISD